MEKDKYF